MGNTNSAEVVRNTESVGRAIQCRGTTAWEFGNFCLCFHFCHTLLHHSQLVLPKWTSLNGRPSHSSL